MVDHLHVDLTEWHRNLAIELKKIASQYKAASDSPTSLQNNALAALSTATLRLGILPGIEGLLSPLQDLLVAYEGLVSSGKSHPLLKNYNEGGGQTLTEWQKALAGNCVGFLELLIEAGWREKDAVILLVPLLVEAGVKGTRLKKSITISGLREWRSKASSGTDVDMRKHADAMLADYRTCFTEQFGRWPPSKQEAEVYVSALPDNVDFRALATYATT